MWPSEATASRIYDVANYGLVAGLLVGVVCTILLVWMGNVKEGYLNERLSSTSNRAVTAEDKVKQLEKRTLSPEQFHTIAETLRSLPSRTTQVFCPSGNEEAFGFAKQISRALEAAHWQTGAGTLQQGNAPQNTGITLFVREENVEGAKQLQDAFTRAGIRSSINAENSLPGIIRVYIGPKP